MIQTYLSDLIGELPEGCEVLVYAGAVLILLFLVAEFFALLHKLFK